MQERTLNMLRNLLAHCESEDVRRVLEWSQNTICGQLTARVDPGAAHPTSQRVHAFYSLVNIAAAGGLLDPLTDIVCTPGLVCSDPIEVSRQDAALIMLTTGLCDHGK